MTVKAMCPSRKRRVTAGFQPPSVDADVMYAVLEVLRSLRVHGSLDRHEVVCCGSASVRDIEEAMCHVLGFGWVRRVRGGGQRYMLTVRGRLVSERLDDVVARCGGWSVCSGDPVVVRRLWRELSRYVVSPTVW